MVENVSGASGSLGVQALPPAPLEQTAAFYRKEIARFQAMARSIKLSAQ
jgi:hypothetical protein